MADDATDLFEQEKGLALKRHLERMLEQVDAAVARAEKGTYGVCEKCGQPIDPERLKALPAATLCLADAQAETKKRVAA
jgi:RNA polymerase-binding transcription factor DksA